MIFVARCRNFVSPFFSMKAKGRWFDEIDGETPSMARETRAIPKTGVVPGLHPN